MRYGFVKSYEDVVFCLDDQKLYLACVISGLVFKHHVFSIEGKALLIALTYSLVKGTTFSLDGQLTLNFPRSSIFPLALTWNATWELEEEMLVGYPGGLSLRWVIFSPSLVEGTGHTPGTID